MNKKHGFIILISAVLLISCDYQKRLYRKGYYVNWFHKNSTHTASALSSKAVLHQTELQVPPTVCLKKHQEPSTILATHSTDKKQNALIVSSNKLAPTDTCHDKLLLKSGDEYLVKILEISDETITYKRCDHLDGPLYTIHKSKVYMITYANGITEHILYEPINKLKTNNTSEIDKEPNPSGEKNYPPNYWLSWLLLVAGFFVGFTWLMAMFTARDARRFVKRHPNKYKGYAEMGFIMYFTFIIWASITLIAFILGIILLFTPDTWGIAMAVGIMLLLMTAVLGAFVLWFIITLEKGEF